MEIWKPVAGFEEYYQVSNLGRVKSNDRMVYRCNTKPFFRKGRILKKATNIYGYEFVAFLVGGKKWQPTVHKLVANAFIREPNKNEQVNHIDKNKKNNCVDNLEWVTCQQNIEHSHAKKYTFKDPYGKRKDVFNLRKFCSENDLSNGNMYSVHSGRMKSYKGWSKWH